MNDRIKQVRKELNLTLEEFGGRIGFTRSSMSNIETGYRNVTERLILAICREFGVSEDWLRSGVGDMFVEDNDSIIGKIIAEMPLDTLSQTVLRTYIEMDSKKREAFNLFIRELADSVMAESKQKAIDGINDIIVNSSAPNMVKADLFGKAALVFNDAFPNVGFGSVDNDSDNASSDLIEKEKFLQMAEAEFDKEKEQELPASSVKKSDVG